MAAGVACGLQNRCEAREASWVGSTPTRSRQPGSDPLWSGVLPRSAWPVLVAMFTFGALPARPAALAQEPVSGDTAAVPVAAPDPGAPLRPSRSAVAVDSLGPPVSAMGAFWRSLVLPGWGQAKVGQPGRGAFYFTMEAASLWMLFKTSQKKAAAERAGDDDLAAARKEQQEDWIVLAVFWALFSGVDAWVSAHMWDFEGALVPPPDGSQGIAVQYSVPVGIP